MDIIEKNIMNSQTVFVLGAGASKPYLFPLGSELKQQMIDCIGNSTIKNTLNTIGFNNDLINSFHDALRYSYHPTIDIFLEKKRIFRDIGAYVIARTLIPFENDVSLFPQRDWYGDLFTLLDFENEKTDPSYPSFISLNYDRSLEHFLYMNIVYNCQDEKLCHNKRRKIRIIHAHGNLGRYPDVHYGLDANDPSTLKNAAERIRIISDRLDDSPDFKEAQQVIAKASNVVFFGFGYDDSTLIKLLGKSDINSKKYHGTGIGISENTKNMLKNTFGENFVLWEDDDCMALLDKIRLAMNLT